MALDKPSEAGQIRAANEENTTMTTLTQDEALELANLREENAKLRAKANKEVYFKVSERGAISVYGLGRFPVTLYLGQWEKLFEHQQRLVEFMVEHASELAIKE